MSTLSDRPWLSAYAPGVPAEIAAVDDTLIDVFDRVAARFPRRAALEFFGAVTSYRELAEQVARVAEGLRSLGVVAGDRVALILPNAPQHVVAFYAVQRLGAVVVEHNPRYTSPELRHLFEAHRARVAIVWDSLADTIAALPDDVRPATVVAVNLTEAMPRRLRLALRMPVPAARAKRAVLTTEPTAAGVVRWSTLARSRKIAASVARPGLDDLAALQFTSGTTGVPKGVMLTHRNLRSNAQQSLAWVPGLKPGHEVFAAVLPLFHAYGLTLCLTTAVTIGACIVLVPTFDVDLTLRAMKRTPPTFFPAVPPMYDALVRGAKRAGQRLTGIRYAISGAMALPAETVARWEAATGGMLVEGYGMTESSPISIGNPMGESRRVGSVGVPFPSTEIRVVDTDDPERDLGIGEAGELLVRGPQVFSGYWEQPEQTALALSPGGWLRTGDIVTVSPDGFVTIVDRLKELIVVGGFNVSPSEVELALRQQPEIEDAAVVGLAKPSGGEMVAAAVVMRPGASFDADRIKAHARGHIAAYKIPRRIVEVDELPRSLVGKVQRREVRERLQSGMVSRAASDE